MSNEKSCYVLMPFAKEYDPVYDVIYQTAREAGYECSRADKKKELGLITHGIILDILFADIIVADITSFNPNVLYELGIAHTLEKPTIILSQELYSGGKLPFDITHMTTIPYSLPKKNIRSDLIELGNSLNRYFTASRIHHNPVTITLSSEELSLANHYRFNFLWGFSKTLEESFRAREAWVISKKLYWERLNALFYKKIIEESILLGKRKELVLMPDNEENKYRKNTLLEKYLKINPNIGEYLRILLTRETSIFSFLPTEITIYDAGTFDVRAILLEPMALEGADHDNDLLIANAIDKNMIRDIRTHNLREKTFDLVLSKIASERLCVEFTRIWNQECLAQNLREWLI